MSCFVCSLVPSRIPPRTPPAPINVLPSSSGSAMSNLNKRGTAMRYNNLGASGLMVSELSFGATPVQPCVLRAPHPTPPTHTPGGLVSGGSTDPAHCCGAQAA